MRQLPGWNIHTAYKKLKGVSRLEKLTDQEIKAFSDDIDALLKVMRNYRNEHPSWNYWTWTREKIDHREILRELRTKRLSQLTYEQLTIFRGIVEITLDYRNREWEKL